MAETTPTRSEKLAAAQALVEGIAVMRHEVAPQVRQVEKR